MEYKIEDKAPLQLIDPEFIEGMAWTQSLGDQKHADNHWKAGVSVAEILGAIKRHVAAIEKGEYFDEGNRGLQHTYAAACGLQYIAYYVRHARKYNKFFDQQYGGPPKARSDVGQRSVPRPDDPGYSGQAT